MKHFDRKKSKNKRPRGIIGQMSTITVKWTIVFISFYTLYISHFYFLLFANINLLNGRRVRGFWSYFYASFRAQILQTLSK